MIFVFLLELMSLISLALAVLLYYICLFLGNLDIINASLTKHCFLAWSFWRCRWRWEWEKKWIFYSSMSLWLAVMCERNISISICTFHALYSIWQHLTTITVTPITFAFAPVKQFFHSSFLVSRLLPSYSILLRVHNLKYMHNNVEGYIKMIMNGDDGFIVMEAHLRHYSVCDRRAQFQTKLTTTTTDSNGNR